MFDAVSENEETAYVLHRRPYRETSLLVDLFARGAGRLRVVARGGRRSRLAGQPFVPLVVAWSGRGGLKTLIRAEPAVPGTPAPPGRALYLGLYVNELLMRLLPEWDPHPALYEGYGRLLRGLAGQGEPEPLLRRFELQLLAELGYGFALDRTADGTPLGADDCYRFVPGSGLMPASGKRHGPDSAGLRGCHLLAMAADDYRDPDTRRCAKQLLRAALAEHLGERPLRSRELFRQRSPAAEPPR